MFALKVERVIFESQGYRSVPGNCVCSTWGHWHSISSSDMTSSVNTQAGLLTLSSLSACRLSQVKTVPRLIITLSISAIVSTILLESFTPASMQASEHCSTRRLLCSTSASLVPTAPPRLSWTRMSDRDSSAFRQSMPPDSLNRLSSTACVLIMHEIACRCSPSSTSSSDRTPLYIPGSDNSFCSGWNVPITLENSCRALSTTTTTLIADSTGGFSPLSLLSELSIFPPLLFLLFAREGEFFGEG
mmetsp:Transcript_4205/g.9634  ORF Transcript_4205/g.9634 Transcript_4205/m.9634 type:complete len:245 (+) Transcript_4205:1181-1915(+)